MILESLLQDKHVRLTKVQHRIMRYIIDNYDEAIFLTALKLAQKVGVSEASVVRLAQTIGFDGYPAMQRKLQQHFHYRISTVNRLVQAVSETRDESDVFVKVLQEDIRNLTQTLREMPIETFRQAVSEMRAANRIFVIGLKEAHAPAMVLANTVAYFKKNVVLLEPKIGHIWDRAFEIETDDLVIGISFPRYARLTFEIVKYAYEKGARVGAITDSLLSPLAAFSHWVLPAHCQLDSFTESFTSSMSIVNALVAALGIQDTDKTMKTMKARESLWKEKRDYVSRLEPGRKG